MQGETAFLQNNRTKAIPLLETALREDPANVKAAQYLGLLFIQAGQADRAIDTYRRILPLAGVETASINYNLGNAYFLKGAASFAIDYYSKALEIEPGFGAALLNRANAYIKTSALRPAISDYQKYLELEPSSSQAGKIQALIRLIEEQFASEERQKLAKEEAERIEAQRRKAIMDDLAASLQDVASDTLGISAGAESVHMYEGEFELE